MAGLDERRASDFLGVLQELAQQEGTRPENADAGTLCAETITTITMVSDALLLRDRSQRLSEQSFGGCCDTLIAKSKTVTIDLDHLLADLKQHNHPEMCKRIAALAEGITILIETTSHACYLVADNHGTCLPGTPSAIDHYPLQRAKLAVSLALDAFSRRPTNAQTMASAAVVATHLEVLKEECSRAEERTDASAQVMFKAIGRGLSGTATMLVAALKDHIKHPTDRTRAACTIFSAPVLSTIDALITYSEDESLAGKPPAISKEVGKYLKPMQGAAMCLSSAFALFIRFVKQCIEDKPINPEAHLARYSESINAAVADLVAATRDVRKAELITN
eukprot:m.484320 g.484320  ORF g.484320 m.484320 type:complete len:335 (+) comp23301_c0_seq1:477-1481(+)